MSSARPASPIRQAASFWSLATLLFAFLFAATAPSPLYPAYQQAFGFSAITVTAIYAAYAATAVLSVLVSGRVSDYVGRRPVTAIAIVIQIAGMLAFIGAHTEAWLYIGRLLQGFATGLATGAIGAWLVDLQPPHNARLGGLVASTALVLGLGGGALGAGLLVQFAPQPLVLVYAVLTAVYLAGIGVIVWAPDVVARRSGWLATIRPEVAVPAPARSLFVACVPSLIATWGLGGFYASLGPALAMELAGSRNALIAGALIFVLLGAAALASVATRDADAPSLIIRASLLLIGGVAASLLGVTLGNVLLLFAGSFVAGLGFGPAFSAAVRSLAPLAPADKRGALLAAVLVVVYTSFSVPTIAAGLATNLVGLQATTYVYGLVVIALAAITAYAMARRPASPVTA